MVVSGAAVSTVKVRDAGVASTLVAASMARTANVWEPCVSVPVVKGDVQLVKAAPSTLHWKVAGDSLDEKVKARVVSVGRAAIRHTRVDGRVWRRSCRR